VTGSTPRWLAIVWVLSALLVGLICGGAWDRSEQDCEVVSHDGGITLQQVCVKDVTR
jgi:hypothetical protein